MTWDRIIHSIIAPHVRFAFAISMDADELLAIGRLAALEAEQTWSPGGGASMQTWVWQHVRGAVTKAIWRATREVADDTVAEALEAEEANAETLAILRQAIVLLQAQLDPDEYRLLWAVYVLGFTPSELADLRGVSSDVIRNRLCRARKKAVTILALAA